ncbi:MAG: hypothetical protein KJ907_08355 [Actinobacteria bacterium]|nr:hypothetical protein [Planctomycetota bacterium]MBU4402729.1 hypothetical protein [Actinomycetota bacterium]
MKRKILIICAGVMVTFIMVLMCVGAMAVNPTDVSVSANVAATITLDMPTTVVNFGAGPLAPGAVYNQAIDATVSSNKGWSLDVRKNQDLTGAVSLEVMPSSNLTFTSDSANPRVTQKRTTATEFPAADDYAVQGTRGGAILSTISYSLDVPWELEPDTYTATHTYTATQP